MKKPPLTVDAVLTPYDITREQPQLFVTKNCKHLSQVLEEFAGFMCFKRGGSESLRTAMAAESMCTATYDSGMQVSGVFAEVLCDAVGNAAYLRTNGPTQLAYRDREMFGHGVAYHSEGFGSPIGHLKYFSRCLSEHTIDELAAHAIEIGKQVRLEYLSGISVEGKLEQVFRQDHRNLILTFTDCTVQDMHGRVLFEPAWGTYDLAVGSAVDSAHSGVAGRTALQLYKPTPRTETVRLEHDEELMACYALVDQLRGDGKTSDSPDTQAGLIAALVQHPDEWLLRAEMLDIAGGFTMGTEAAAPSDDDWDWMCQINVGTLRNTLMAAVPVLRQQQCGALVNVGAFGAIVGNAEMSDYSCAKSSVMRLTESLSKELKAEGINVNAVLPSIIDTPPNRQAMPDADFKSWVTPEQLAKVMCFLASDDASAIHGALIPVKGLS